MNERPEDPSSEEALLEDGRPAIPKDPLRRLEHELRYRFKSENLLMEALTHRSYVNECPEPDVRDNERFEFLGDAVIDLVVSSELLDRHPEAREGPLSKMRAALVSEAGLARAAEAVHLGPALRLGRGEELSGGRQKPSILADGFEAVIAAIYLDSDLATVTRVLLGCLIMPDGSALDRGDPKTELQQRVQAELHITPVYRLVEESGPDHAKRFVVELLVGEEVLGRGEGRTKKEAEQRAAARALAELDDELRPLA